MGLKVPIVYNSSGYEKTDSLRLLDALVDIYLVDMRYGDNKTAAKYSSCHDYVEINRAAVKEMCRQAGRLKLSPAGIAEKGIIIRHLILPNNLSGTENVFRFISDDIGNDTYVSFMSQYYPAYRASGYAELSRGIKKKEYDEALSLLYKHNLKNGWVQEYMGGHVNPNFAGTNM
ncbi:MAG: hypothetical protein U9R52_04435 [Candidatus Omnitrophota bacterium]|nr:hypothetical protein [Candidatus Omnitrophota bacterium]